MIGISEKWGLGSHLFGFRRERIVEQCGALLLVVRKGAEPVLERATSATRAPAPTPKSNNGPAVRSDERASAGPTDQVIRSLYSSVSGSIRTRSPLLTSMPTRTLTPLSSTASFMPLPTPLIGGDVSATVATTDCGSEIVTSLPSTSRPL